MKKINIKISLGVWNPDIDRTRLVPYPVGMTKNDIVRCTGVVIRDDFGKEFSLSPWADMFLDLKEDGIFLQLKVDFPYSSCNFNRQDVDRGDIFFEVLKDNEQKKGEL